MLPSKADFRSYRWNVILKCHKKVQKEKLEVKNTVQGESVQIVFAVYSNCIFENNYSTTVLMVRRTKWTNVKWSVKNTPF